MWKKICKKESKTREKQKPNLSKTEKIVRKEWIEMLGEDMIREWQQGR